MKHARQKECFSCGAIKSIEEFSVHSKTFRHRSTCRACENRQQRNLRAKLREMIFTKYGGRCACCGETIKEFLTIDHADQSGKADRKLFGSKVYNAVRRRGFPPDKYRILCFNCNCSIGHYGYCPHSKERNICPEKAASNTESISEESSSEKIM